MIKRTGALVSYKFGLGRYNLDLNFDLTPHSCHAFIFELFLEAWQYNSTLAHRQFVKKGTKLTCNVASNVMQNIHVVRHSQL